MKICIFGMGNMGKFFKNFFNVRNYYVRGYDIVKEKSEIDIDELSEFDVIFVCVPMENIKDALKEIKRYAKRDALLVDISSVKKDVIPLFLSSGFDFLSIHPMFGSDSEIGLSNILIVYESGRDEERKILDEFRKAGAILNKVSPERHDKLMARVQGVTHFSLLAMAEYLKDQFDEMYFTIGSPIFLVLLKLASRIVNQDWKLYYTIQKNSEEERKKFISKIIEVDKKISDKNSFKSLFEELRETFKDGGNSTLILDSYKATIKPESLEGLRGYIRLIDSLILRLIERRVEIGKKIAQEKLKKNEPIEISDVEEVKLREIASRSKLNPERMIRIFEEIMALTKEEEYISAGITKTIAVLGPPGSFSEEMAMKLTSTRLPFKYCSGIEEIVKLVENGKVDYGIIPIENSVHGTVIASLDMLMRSNVEVFGEAEMEIRHNLVAKRKMDLKEIKVLYSHPQAVSQCLTFINNYLPNAEIRYTRSTSDAISLLDEKSAAITSEFAARMNRLYILKKDIQDLANNKTRFYIIRRKGGENKGRITAIFFGVEDKPGALFNVLEIFKKRNINLRKLESRPLGTKLGDYVFFAEVEKMLNEEELEELKERTVFCKVVGVFDRIERLDVFKRK